MDVFNVQALQQIAALDSNTTARILQYEGLYVGRSANYSPTQVFTLILAARDHGQLFRPWSGCTCSRFSFRTMITCAALTPIRINQQARDPSNCRCNGVGGLFCGNEAINP